jgi:hypothetical protein
MYFVIYFEINFSLQHVFYPVSVVFRFTTVSEGSCRGFSLSPPPENIKGGVKERFERVSIQI